MSTSGRAAGGPPTGAAGGDIAGTGTSTYPNPTLTAIGTATGPIGSSTVAPVVTIDTKGRVTALTQATITASPLTVATVQINAAALRTLNTLPVTIVAAPGASTALWPISFWAEFVPGTGCILAAAPGLYYGPPTTQDVINDVAFAQMGGLTGNGPPDSEIALFKQALQPILTAAVVNKAIVFSELPSEPQAIGPIGTVTISNPGVQYAPGDTGTIDDELYTGGATYIVTTTNGVPGLVTGLTVTAAGDGYGVGDTCTTATGGAQPGIGTGLELDIATVTGLSFSLYVTVAYRTITTH